MRRIITLAVCTLLCAGLAMAVSSAQNQPASKATAKVGLITTIADPNAGFATILEQDIKTPNGKDLFIDVSLECGLATSTTSKSKGGNRDTAQAEAGVFVQVLIDNEVALPGEVVFCRRTQDLSTTLDGQISQCLIQDPTCTAEQIESGDCGQVIDPACIENDLLPEEVSLFLDSMNANAFNFIKTDLPSGVHTVSIQARIATRTCTYAGDVPPFDCPDDGLGSASATASIGNGSMTVETVRMIKDEDVELE
ncbi:MAG: hypothetical protein OEQ13_13570 [Acidobacteriota bacterium]|nr:hypothetical protein [Acidobacteriota bacterium]